MLTLGRAKDLAEQASEEVLNEQHQDDSQEQGYHATRTSRQYGRVIPVYQPARERGQGTDGAEYQHPTEMCGGTRMHAPRSDSRHAEREQDGSDEKGIF